MYLSVSNIAWPLEQDSRAEEMLQALGVTAIELAPTRYWPDLSAVSRDTALEAAEALRARGFQISAFQAVLFGQPQLQVFGPDGGKACAGYLAAVCRLAGWMGAPAVVLGAPKNRLRGNLAAEAAFELAVPFFSRLGEAAETAGTTLCLEPNPAGYGADFLLNVSDTAALVDAVNSLGVAVNFDMGEQAMHAADTVALLRKHGHLTGHFHVSEPMLEPFDASRAAHRQAAAVLREMDYTGAVSLEMKIPSGGLPEVEKALAALKSAYQL